MSLNYDLKTKYAYQLNFDNPLSEYPRPTLVRDSYINLNGYWDLAITDINDSIPQTFEKKILVPYVVESALSGLRYDLKKKEALVYKKEFVVEKSFLNDVVMLHFGGIMQSADIYFNNHYLGRYNGGFKEINLDVSQLINIDNNTLIVKVYNKPDLNYAVSKEGKKRGGMWYTKTSGIFKTVWLESYSNMAITKLHIETNVDGSLYCLVDSLCDSNKVSVIFDGETIFEKEVENDFVLMIDNPQLWSPNHPNLYYIVVDNGYDKVRSYFAFRKWEIKNNKFYLNDEEIFVNGILNQSYFSDGIYTPASYQVFKDDIMLAKKYGFNALRMHIKLEAEMLYYYADRYGILIMQDLPNSGKYHYMKDTVLPTVLHKWPFVEHRVSKERRLAFLETGMEIIDKMKKHPSCFYITIFNEGWGQFEADKMYQLFKDYEPNFIYDTTSGWFKKKKSDVLSIHNYFFKLKVPKSKRPVVLSEYGGYSLNIKDHIFNDSKTYGYHNCETKEDLNRDLQVLFSKIEELKKDGLAGAVYTQLTDIEDETNGLITYDREVIKMEE